MDALGDWTQEWECSVSFWGLDQCNFFLFWDFTMLMMRMLTIEVLVIMIVRMHRLLSSFLRVLGVSPKAEVRWDVEKNRGAATWKVQKPTLGPQDLILSECNWTSLFMKCLEETKFKKCKIRAAAKCNDSGWDFGRGTLPSPGNAAPPSSAVAFISHSGWSSTWESRICFGFNH